MSEIRKILVTASTFPAHDKDPVPRFVIDHVTAMHKLHPKVKFDVLAPHNSYSKTLPYKEHEGFNEYRFHYFWPFTRWELLTGRAIAPTLKQRPILYLQVPFLFIATTFATWRHIIKHSPDLIYAHWFTPQGIAAAFACLLTGKKFVFTSHAGDVIIWRKIPFSKHLIKWVCDRAEAYTAVSQQTADKLFSMLPNDKRYRDKLSIIPMGTELPKSVNLSRRSSNSPNLLFIGRLVSIKGVDYLLRALADLSNNYEFTLNIAGDGQQRQELEQLVDDLGLNQKVNFVGYVGGSEKETLFRGADIVCIPSIKEGENTEGLPVTLMESLAAGKIVIASDVTGAQEYITDGKNGFLFEQSNTKKLEKALLKAFKLTPKQTERMSQAAVELSQNFSWPVVAAEHYKLFERVLR